MSITFTAAPDLPDINSPDTFNSRASALFSWLTQDLIPEMEAVTGLVPDGGDFAVNTDTFYVDVSADRVGVGTSSPDGTLHVVTGTAGSVTANAQSDDLIVENNADGGMSILVPDSSYSRITFGSPGDSTGAAIRWNYTNGLMQVGPQSSSAQLAFWSGNGIEAGRFDPNGYFGIGTNLPSVRMHVKETTDANPFLVENSHATFTKALCSLSATRAASSAYNMLTAYSGGYTDLEFKFSGDGNGTCDGSWTGGGADYAEYFEWSDGNPDGEDRRGWSVVLDGDKIAPAQPGDDPFGVVSVNPSVVGDGDMDRWKGKYLRDDYGAYLWEDYSVVEWQEVIPAVMDGDDVIEPESRVDHSYPTDAVPDGITVPEDATIITGLKRKVLNPDYDPDMSYTPRSERPEWDAIGLMGKLRLRKGQPVGARWIKMRDVSADVEEWLVR